MRTLVVKVDIDRRGDTDGALRCEYVRGTRLDVICGEMARNFSSKTLAQRFGVSFFKSGYGTNLNTCTLIMPDWMLCILFAVAPLLYWFTRRRQFQGENVCSACGYDLRATMDRCPECGDPIKAKGGNSVTGYQHTGL